MTPNTDRLACAACGFVPDKLTPYCPKCAKGWQGVSSDAAAGNASAPSAATAGTQPLYEYHAVGVKSIASAIGVGAGIQSECDKRAKAGWRLASSHYDADDKRHVLIFERPVR